MDRYNTVLWSQYSLLLKQQGLIHFLLDNQAINFLLNGGHKYMNFLQDPMINIHNLTHAWSHSCMYYVYTLRYTCIQTSWTYQTVQPSPHLSRTFTVLLWGKLFCFLFFLFWSLTATDNTLAWGEGWTICLKVTMLTIATCTYIHTEGAVPPVLVGKAKIYSVHGNIPLCFKQWVQMLNKINNNIILVSLMWEVDLF